MFFLEVYQIVFEDFFLTTIVRPVCNQLFFLKNPQKALKS